MISLFLSQRGQGSSVFQLLIAAVVAVAILGVLLNMIGVIKPPGSGDAASVAKEKLKEAYSNKGTPRVSEKIQVRRDSGIITPQGVAGYELGIEASRVCLGVTRDLSTQFGNPSDPVLQYESSTARDVKVVAVCSTGNDLEDYVTNTLSSWDIEDVICSDSPSSYPNDDWCFVGVIKAS